MKKISSKIGAILITTLFLISAIEAIGVNATMTTQSNDTTIATTPELGQKIPLTNSQIEKSWPNIPSAKQLYENDICMVVDLRYSGKQASSMDDTLPDPKSPTIFDITSTIANYTTTTVDFHSGALNSNAPQIWLQYNSTVWVKVPSKYVQNTNIEVIAQDQQLLPSTWAVGMYANPQNIAGAYPVTGVCTYGQWNTATFGTSGMYLGTNVLTVCSNNIGYQQAMQLDSNGRSIAWNWWDLSSADYDTGNWGTVTGAVTGQPYSNYIRYVSGSGWQFWWNQIYMGTMTGDPSTTVRTGNQANVVVESNDFTSSDFNNFITITGGTYNPGNIPLCAAIYQFNGGWKPSASGDSAPAGYVYLGGTYVNGIAIGGQAPPSTWGANNIGIYSSLRERFAVGVGLTQLSHGYTLWTAGTV